MTCIGRTRTNRLFLAGILFYAYFRPIAAIQSVYLNGSKVA